MAAAAVVVAVVRVLSVPRWLQDLDAVDFARSLEGYDLAAYAPHFPGYPVYVGAAKMASVLGASEVVALCLPGIVLTALATVVLAVAGRRWFGEVGGVVAGAVWLVHPFVGLAAVRPSSDGAGAALVALGVGLMLVAARSEGAGARRVEGALAGVCLALALGVRPSLAPLVAPLVVLAAALLGVARRAVVAGFVGGAAGWVVPWMVGFGDQVVACAAPFLEGHFTRWGGGVGAAEASLVERAGQLVMWGWTVVLGGAWAGRGVGLVGAGVGVVVAACGAVGGVRGAGAGRRWAVGLVGVVAVYAVWVWLFQNVDKPRHLLPLVPLVVLGLAGGAATVWRWAGARSGSQGERVGWGRVVWGVVGVVALVGLAVEQGRACWTASMVAPPAVQAMVWADREVGPEAMYVLGEEARLWNHYAPHLRAQRFGTLGDALAGMDAAGMRPRVLVVSDHVRGLAEGVRSGEVVVEPLASFGRDRWAGAHYSAVRLFRVRRVGRGVAVTLGGKGGR